MNVCIINVGGYTEILPRNDYWTLTQRESQMQKLSRAKYETFNKRLALVLYANMQDIFSLFPGIFLVQKQCICF